MKLPATVLAAILLAWVGAAVPAAAAKPPYRVYGSCAAHKPYRPARHCGFAGPDSVRATFVFESRVGVRKLKVCQKVTGVPLNKRHDCVTAGKAFAHLAIPFHFTGIHTPITARVTVFAKKPGQRHYAKAGTATLSFAP